MFLFVRAVLFRWYFTETNRRDAERFLEQPHNGKGTFLIRPSDTNQGKLAQFY